ncbi:MAG: general secretion pathway protein GspC [Marinobacter sp.]|nr:general secretion pathway protein GspC [Marinobacter sp.]
MTAILQKLPLVSAIGLGLVMSASLAWQGYAFLQAEQQRADASQATATVRTEPQQQTRPEINLAEVSLFGRVVEDAAPPPVTENLPTTNLRLFLRGVLAATGDFPASALIEGGNGQTEAYLVGDELPGNARLRSVHPNRVILERGGRLENLYFPELDDSSGLEFAAHTPDQDMGMPQTQPVQPTAASGMQSQPAVGPGGQVSDERREEIRQRLEELRQRLRANTN